MYSTMYRHAKRLFWPDERRKLQLQRELERTQWLSGPELERWQLKKIQQLLKYACEHVPYYRERYQREGIHPEDIKSLKDFASLPFLTREDVFGHLDELVSPDFAGRLHRGQTTGTTGQPMRFYYEDSWSDWDAALRRRGRDWQGARVRDGDKEAWIWGADSDVVHWSRQRRLRAQLMRRRYLNAYNMSEARMQAFAEMLVRWQPAMFRAYGQALPLFAQFVKERGITGIRPRLIETTAEKLTAPQRRLLEEVFHCPVINYYSARELGAIAYPCEIGRLHVCETRYLELVTDGQPVGTGQLGDVVVTSLNQYGMPFIRYKPGDLAVYEADSCPCGRGMPALRELVGRTNDAVVTAEGRWVHFGYFVTKFWQRLDIVRFQVYQPDRQHLEVRVVCKQGVDAASLEEIGNEIVAELGESMNVSIQVVDHIEPAPGGKLRFVISDVTRDSSSD